jgi:hypothetical protein
MSKIIRNEFMGNWYVFWLCHDRVHALGSGEANAIILAGGLRLGLLIRAEGVHCRLTVAYPA